MQGRLLDGNHITGWEKRQPKREDSGDDETGAKSAAARKREQRERKKEAENNGMSQQCHDESRNVTLDKDKDKDKEVKDSVASSGDSNSVIPFPEKQKTAITFAAFLSRCRDNNEKAISDYKPVFDYAKKAGLPIEFIEIQWLEFKRRYSEEGGRKTKRYKDWRQTFRNSVEENWFGLWVLDGNEYKLTSKGRIAEKVSA